MTENSTEKRVDPLEELDFHEDLPCESKHHPKQGSGPARWITTWVTPLPCGCEHTPKILMCEGCFRFYRLPTTWSCHNCCRNLGDVWNMLIGTDRIAK